MATWHENPQLVSSIFPSIPYTHYAFARADGAHMVYGFLPFVVGVLILLGLDSPRKSISNIVSMAFFSASLSSFVLWLHPFVWEKIQGDWRPVQGLGCAISASSSTAKRTEEQIALVERYGGPEHSFLAEPFFPGLYSVFRVRSPVWEIWSSVQQSKYEAEEEMARLKAADPHLILIDNFALDGQEERRYCHHHQYLFKYISEHYKLIDARRDQPDLLVFVK